MDDETVCELFIDADVLLNGNTDIQTKIKNSPEYHQYCPDNKQCLNRAEGIGALSAFLFTNFYNTESSYYEHFMMWLAHKLFKIAKKRNNENVNVMTLSSAYEKYLETNMGNLRQWHIINDLRGVKYPNLRYMSELYMLLKRICNTIAYYKKNNKRPVKLGQYSAKCLNQYRNLYKTFSGDDSYLPLLEKLKKIYDDFKTSAIKDDADKKKNIESHLLELTPMKEIDSHSTKNLKTLDSNDPKDQLQSEKTSEIPEEKNTLEEPKDPKVKGKSIEQPTKLKSTVDQTSNQREEPSFSEVELKIPGNEQENSRESQGMSIEPTKESLSTKLKDQAQPQEISQEMTRIKPQPEPPPNPELSPTPEPLPHPESQPQKELTPQIELPTQTESSPQIESQQGPEPQPEQDSETQLKSQANIESQDNENVIQPASTPEKSSMNHETIKKITEKGLLHDFYKLHLSSFYKNLTYYGQRLYGSTSTSLTKGYSAFNEFVDYLITQPNKVNVTLPSVDNNIQPKDSGSDSTPSDDTSETLSLSSTQASDKKAEGGRQENKPGGKDQINETESEGKISKAEESIPSLTPKESTEVFINITSDQQIEKLPSKTKVDKIKVEKGIFEIGFPEGVFKGYKLVAYSVIIIAIPIILALMYKYFPFGCRKELKKKKNMKKVINMFGVNEATKRVINTTDRKKQVQIIINSSTQKKQNKKFTNSSTQKKQDERLTNSSTQKKQDEKLTNLSTQKKRNKKLKNSSTQKKQDERLTNSSTQKKKTKQFINSIYWEKYPLLNIHKLMKTDSVPFVILFLFIFYVYKKKGYCLE
ncbi:BIR protein [Plasmodium berghei]|uniref:BIR protein n=1 Tax=Plasmodium berghei TaxID=5821 RepID=A0A1D3L6R6_PLABE|nr:BIR protein [Plasmodium berghei]